MTRLFDGMSGLLSGVFGDPITFRPAIGLAVTVQSIFREAPIEIAGADGSPVLLTDPTWRVSRGQITPPPRTGDRVETPDGRSWRIRSEHASGSPAADAFLLYELEYLP